MALSLTSRQTLEAIRDQFDATGTLPARSTIETELSKHYLEFGFLTESALRRELQSGLFPALLKILLSGPLTISASARESIGWVLQFIAANGNMPARNLVDWEIAKHFSVFRFADEATLRRALGRSSAVAAIKIILSTSSV